MMNLTRDELDILCQIARQAGQEIMDVYSVGGESWLKEDDSPLTEADLRADKVIRSGLERHFPNVFILSEESGSAAGCAVESFFLVDPLDGTKEFLKRNGEFTVNIALIHNAAPVAGVVFAPALGELFVAAVGFGARKIDRHGETSLMRGQGSAQTPLRVIGSRSHGGEKLASWLDQLPCPHAFVAAGSSLKFCRIADGLADIYPRFGPTSQWDTAAAQCILEISGGLVTDLAGSPLRYGLDRPILNPEFVACSDPALVSLFAA